MPQVLGPPKNGVIGAYEQLNIASGNGTQASTTVIHALNHLNVFFF